MTLKTNINRLHSEQEYLAQNFRFLLILRSIAMASQITALLFMLLGLHIQIPLLPVILIIGALLIYTVRSWHWQNSLLLQGKGVFFQQLIIDVMALSLLVYFTGGATNPFIFFFLLPITFAAATLDFKQTCIISLLAVLSYTLLMFFHVPLAMHHHARSSFDIHIWGMWYGFLVSASLVTYFVSRIGAGLKKRVNALATVREQILQNEQVLALGSLAAGTAHELGTPLSTLAILLHEIELEYQDDIALNQDLMIARQQIDRCKMILSRMAADAGLAQANSGGSLKLSTYLNSIIEDWKAFRPDAKLSIHLNQPDQDNIFILTEHTLTQAIQNVLSNADHACQKSIQFYAEWSKDSLLIKIIDDGPGIKEQVLEQLGHPITDTTYRSGMGIGLFLSQITVNRLGGQMAISDIKTGGTEVCVKLPLKNLMTVK